jgi:hypothetical protein
MTNSSLSGGCGTFLALTTHHSAGGVEHQLYVRGAEIDAVFTKPICCTAAEVC